MAAQVILGCAHRFHRLPQHFLHTRLWFVGTSTKLSRQYHKSPVLHNSSLSNLHRLLDQGRRSILKLKTRDKVPEDYQLIYKASLELTLRIGYPIVMMCAFGLLGILVYHRLNKQQLVVPEIGLKFAYPVFEFWFASVVVVLLVMAGSSIMLKYPFRIYKHNTKREYVGIYLNPFIPTLRHVKFTSASPTKFKNPLYSIMENCHYVLDGKKKTFFVGHFFRVPKDLTDMNDKPENVN